MPSATALTWQQSGRAGLHGHVRPGLCICGAAADIGHNERGRNYYGCRAGGRWSRIVLPFQIDDDPANRVFRDGETGEPLPGEYVGWFIHYPFAGARGYVVDTWIEPDGTRAYRGVCHARDL